MRWRGIEWKDRRAGLRSWEFREFRDDRESKNTVRIRQYKLQSLLTREAAPLSECEESSWAIR